MSAAVNDIRKALSRGQLLVVAGTGVSAGATKGAPTSTWQGLIKDGIQHCVDTGLRDQAWADRANGDVDSKYESDLIAAAEKTTDALGGRRGGHYTQWLKEAVGDLVVNDTTLLDSFAALADAGALISTTNYDGLIDNHLHLRPVTWRNPIHLQEALREGGSIVHIHGYWADPSSVVFGSSSYADIMRDDAAVGFLKASVYTRTILFVGFGAGLRDPNFSSVRNWMLSSMPGTSYQHYRLVRESELDVATAEHSNEPIVSLSYGHEYSDLAPFLASLSAGASAPAMRSLWDVPVGQSESDGKVRTDGVPLPTAKPDAALVLRLQNAAQVLGATVASADSPLEDFAIQVGGGEEADVIRRFATTFEEEITEVLVIAQQPNQVSPEKVAQATQWAERLLAIGGLS